MDIVGDVIGLLDIGMLLLGDIVNGVGGEVMGL